MPKVKIKIAQAGRFNGIYVITVILFFIPYSFFDFRNCGA